MSTIEKEVGHKPSKELLELKEDIFDYPTTNTMLLLISPRMLGPRLKRLIAIHRRLETKFMEADQDGNPRIRITRNTDKTWGPRRADDEQREMFLWTGAEIRHRLNMAMAGSPRAQARFHALFEKIQLGTSTFTEQRQKDERSEAIMEKMPRAERTAPKTEEERGEEQKFYPLEPPEGGFKDEEV